MTDLQSTHSHDCWDWGPKHYKCAVREIKALREEVERLRKMHQDAYQRGLQAGSRGLREMYDAIQEVKRQDAWGNARLTEALMEAEERAERAEAENKRLAEALALLPDEIVMIEHNPDEGPLMFCCGRKVKLSWLHDLIPTHDKDCWYARMRALLSAVERDAPEVAL